MFWNMKKKKLNLNKIKISNLVNFKGGENPHTEGNSCGCLNIVADASCADTQYGAGCQIETIDIPCNGSQGCQSDYTCTPSNWGWNCQYTLFNC